MRKNKTTHVDIPAIQNNMAARLMFHHLGLAAAMFEAIGEKGDSAVRVDLEAWTSNIDHMHMQEATLAFFDAMVKTYARMGE